MPYWGSEIQLQARQMREKFCGEDELESITPFWKA